MPVTITRYQRDALYQDLLTHLSGIGDLWLAINRDDFETADRLGHEFVAELRLIVEDLGWGDGPEAETVELTLSPAELRGVLGRLRARADRHRKGQQKALAEVTAPLEQSEIVIETCDQVLAALG
jgi:hypothetical protein